MAHYEWNDKLMIGEETVDAQHKWLVDTYNYLMSTYKTGLTTDQLVTSLTHLYEYTENHFKYEEELQLRCGFPGYNKHKQLHEAFKQKALDLVDHVTGDSNTEDLARQLNATIGAWLIQHIKMEDSKIAPYLTR